MEIELFGTEHANGEPRKVGALEEAHGGTLFIDEVADMPRETQNKILRVLVDQTFQRVGGSTKVAVDVRIISSTSRDLEREIARAASARTSTTVSVVPIRVPRSPSGARTSPCWSITSWSRFPRPPGCRSAASATTPWRCCRRTTGRATCASSQQRRAADDPRRRRPDASSPPHAAAGDRLDGAVDAQRQRRRAPHVAAAARGARIFEREYLLAQINRFGGNISRTAEFVGMERSALHRKLKALGIG
jgi:two-component system, NtrC family, nitrogen regulation response regulator NtrX